MPEHNEANRNSNSTEYSNHNTLRASYARFKRLPIGLRRILTGTLLCILAVVTISILHPSLNERVKFGTDMTLNLLILFAISVQAFIHTQQWGAMSQGLEIERAKTNPRLRIARVRAENFEVGKRPVFIVTIANDGLIAATGVQIYMEVFIDSDKLGWVHAPMVNVPASGREHYFIRSSWWLEKTHIDGFNSGTTLKVVGHFDYSPNGKTDFCYKYVPWDEDRPKDVPQFVPCDFEPRLNTTLHLSGIEAKATVETVGVVIRKATSEPKSDKNQNNQTEQSEEA